MSYEPSPWGRRFHALKTFEALGGGSAGPGKSVVLLHDADKQIILQHERCLRGEFDWGRAPGHALHLRKEFPRLQETINRSFGAFKDLDPAANYVSATHTWHFKSGYKYTFGHLKDKDTFLNYRSQEYTWMGIDEAGEVDDENIYHELVSRVRTTDPMLEKMLAVRLMSNPCAGWLREYFVDPNPMGFEILNRRITLSDGSEHVRSRIFLPAKLSDNPNPMFRIQYEANLRDKPPHIRAALLDGYWYVVAGAFFAHLWDPDRVVIKQPFRIPTGWRKFRSGDWGYKAPCVILWWAVSPEGEMICYRERVFNGPRAKQLLDARQVAERIKEIEMHHDEWNMLKGCSRLTGPMDNQLWEERGQRGASMAEDMARVGVYWFKASKGRLQASQQVVKRLSWRGYNDRPALMFFPECLYCINTIPSLATDELDPELPAQGGQDHGYDAVSYACAANIMPSGREEKDWLDDDDDNNVVPIKRGRFGYGGN